MSLFARVALGLALVLPLTAYVAGSLIAAEPAPAQYAPIELREASSSPTSDPGLVDPDGEAPDESGSPSPTPSPSPSATSTPTPSPTPSKTPKPAPSKKPDGAGQPEVVRPGAIDPDDDDYDDIDDDDDDDDTDD